MLKWKVSKIPFHLSIPMNMQLNMNVRDYLEFQKNIHFQTLHRLHYLIFSLEPSETNWEVSKFARVNGIRIFPHCVETRNSCLLPTISIAWVGAWAKTLYIE